MNATIEVGSLRRLLAATMPAADTVGLLLALDTIHLEAGHGVLLATATNRFIAAHARAEAEGTLEPVLLRAADAKLLMAHLRTIKPPQAKITLSVSEGRLSVRSDATGFSFTPEDIGYWPKSLPKVFGGALPNDATKIPADLSRLIIGKGPLSCLTRILATAPQEPARWRIAHQQAPILIDVGDWLLIALMTMRPMADTEEPVPFGLPAPKPGRARKAAPPKATTRRRAS